LQGCEAQWCSNGYLFNRSAPQAAPGLIAKTLIFRRQESTLAGFSGIFLPKSGSLLGALRTGPFVERAL